jgi:hypothetical protein
LVPINAGNDASDKGNGKYEPNNNIRSNGYGLESGQIDHATNEKKYNGQEVDDGPGDMYYFHAITPSDFSM